MSSADYGSTAADVEALDAPLKKTVFDNKEVVPLFVWAIFPCMGLLVIFSVPSLAYSLYKVHLQTINGSTTADSAMIAGRGLMGSMVLTWPHLRQVRLRLDPRYWRRPRHPWF